MKLNVHVDRYGDYIFYVYNFLLLHKSIILIKIVSILVAFWSLPWIVVRKDSINSNMYLILNIRSDGIKNTGYCYRKISTHIQKKQIIVNNGDKRMFFNSNANTNLAYPTNSTTFDDMTLLWIDIDRLEILRLHRWTRDMEGIT